MQKLRLLNCVKTFRQLQNDQLHSKLLCQIRVSSSTNTKYHIVTFYRLFDIWFNFSSNAIIICFKSEFSFLSTSTSPLSAVFSSSKYLALIAIWFSLRRLASRDRLAASLFLYRFAQYLLFFSSSGTNCFLRFLMIGWGLSSSSLNLRVAGSKSWNWIPSLIKSKRQNGRGN